MMTRFYRLRNAYSCWDCDKTYLDKELAQRCCEVKKCSRCGCSLGKHEYYTACAPCREVLTIQRAEVVSESYADDGVIYSETHSGDWNDGYASEVGAMLEKCDDEGVEPPFYVHPCKANHFQFDPYNILDLVHDDHHEGAIDHDKEGLFAFFKEWNAKQNLRSYYFEKSKVIVLDRERFDQFLTQPDPLFEDTP